MSRGAKGGSMKTADLLAYIRAHNMEAWEVDGRIIAVSCVLREQAEMLDTLAILDSYQDARKWLGY